MTGAIAGAGAGAAGAAAAALAQAVKASGVIVLGKPVDFFKILAAMEARPLIVTAKQKVIFLGMRYQYLTSYKGLAFVAKSREPLEMPADAQIIEAKQIWIPG